MHPIPCKERGVTLAPHVICLANHAGVVGLLPAGTAFAFSGSLRGLKWIPSKWRSLIPPQGGNASRWVAIVSIQGTICREINETILSQRENSIHET
jgi:hypothetical protein